MDYSTEDVRMREAHDDDDEDDDLDVEKAVEKSRRHLDDDDDDDEDEDEDGEEVRAGSSRKTKVCAILSYGQPLISLFYQRRRKDAIANPYIDLVATVDDDDDDDEDDEEAEAGEFSAIPSRWQPETQLARIPPVPTTR
jgi:hypothetical protein